jgi:hypothetical protein
VVHVYERYVDSAAAVAHLRTFGRKFGGRFAGMVDRTRFTVYGTRARSCGGALASLQPCRSPSRSRLSRAGSPSPGSRPGGAGLRLACCLQRWPAASATGGGLPVAWGNTGGGRGGTGGGATGKVALYFPRNKNAALPVRVQRDPLTISGLKKWVPDGAFRHELSRPKRVSWLPAYGTM